MIRAFPDEKWLRKVVEKPPADAAPEHWHVFYINAWHALRNDRHYFAFGGETSITFSALDAYARRYGIEGEAFERFHTFMSEIDAEWLAKVSRDSKKAKEDR